MGTIQSGVGVGLKFDGRGSLPGYMLGTSTPLEQELLAQNLRRGDVFYDLGANVGFFCVIAARLVQAEGMVYAFEPTPTLAARIRKNAAMNSFGHLEVIEAAVTNFNGQTEFGVVGELNVNNSINNSNNNSNTAVISVPTLTIDEFAKTHQPPTLMMIDVEGAEIEALEGAMKTIQQYRPTIMIEVHWLGERFQRFVDEKLLPLGYEAQTFEGQPLPKEPAYYHCILTSLPQTTSAKG